MEYIALDAHKRYSFASVEGLDGHRRTEARVEGWQRRSLFQTISSWRFVFLPARAYCARRGSSEHRNVVAG
jgi:hypothetical protein